MRQSFLAHAILRFQRTALQNCCPPWTNPRFPLLSGICHSAFRTPQSALAPGPPSANAQTIAHRKTERKLFFLFPERGPFVPGSLCFLNSMPPRVFMRWLLVRWLDGYCAVCSGIDGYCGRAGLGCHGGARRSRHRYGGGRRRRSLGRFFI